MVPLWQMTQEVNKKKFLIIICFDSFGKLLDWKFTELRFLLRSVTTALKKLTPLELPITNR
jgi:hypothetical protein